jgi:hypothetical protein
VVWYVNTDTGRDFYSLNATVPEVQEAPAQNDVPSLEPDEAFDSETAVDIEKPNDNIITEVEGI